MTDFRGKNSIRSARRLARERSVYNTTAFSPDDKQVVDFNFAEKTLYGRVDRSLTPVVPKLQYLSPITSQAGEGMTMLLMDFVGKQFADFSQAFANACRLQLLPGTDPVFSSLQIKNAFQDPTTLYEAYSDNLMALYVDSFLTKYSKTVNNFSDFLFLFPEYLRYTRDIFPISFSGFQKSSQSSIFTSGLVLDFAGIKFGDDPAKQKLIFDSPFYSYFLNAAVQYGFSIDKRNPGVLVSDLTSPVTAVYRKKVGMTTIDKLFRTRYEKTLYSDLDYLLELMTKAYNAYVNLNPLKRSFIVCNNNKLKSIVNKRQYINTNNINIQYHDDIIRLYITLRNIEERSPFDESVVDRIYHHARSIQKHSHKSMLDYIDDQFRKIYNQKTGSLNFYKKRQEKKLDNE